MFENRSTHTLLSNGKKLFGMLHMPIVNEDTKVPLVLMLHGFAGNKSGRYRLFVHLSEQLAKCGIASFRFDFRGAGDSEGDFRDTTIHTMLEDGLSAFKYIHHIPHIDSEKISFVGLSMGGCIASLLTEQLSTKSLSLWAAVYDGKPWIKSQQTEYMGTELHTDFIDQFLAVDMKKTLKNIKDVPFSYFVGKEDPMIFHYHYQKYKENREDGEFHLLDRSDHSFSDKEERYYLLKHTTEFFVRTLCPEHPL